MTDTKQKIISIRSSDRLTGTIDNFECGFNNIKNIHWMEIQEMIIPMSHYPITNLNNVIKFNDGVNRDAILKNGFYSKTTLVTEIKTKMDAISTLTFTVTVDTITEKITISSTSNFTLRFNESNTPYKELGYDNLLLSGAMSYVAQKIFNINRRYHSFNVYSDQLTKFHSSVIGSDKKGALLFRPLNAFAGPNNHLHYSHDQNAKYLIHYNNLSQLKYIDIRIRDLDDNIIDFNGVDEIILNLIAYIR